MRKKLVFCAMGVALSMVTSYIKLWHMPMGGSITLMSMFFVTLIGYWYGFRWGIMTAIAYGALQLILDPYIVSIPQLVCDYILAFGSLGLSGLFKNRKNGLYKGYIIGVTGRFIFTFLSGVIFFGMYAADYGMSAPLYSFLYNGGYIVPELVLTLIIISLKPVRNVLERAKTMATIE